MLEGILVGEVIKVVSPRKAIPEAGREIYISDTLCVRSHDGNENAFASMSVKAKHFPSRKYFLSETFLVSTDDIRRGFGAYDGSVERNANIISLLHFTLSGWRFVVSEQMRSACLCSRWLRHCVTKLNV